MQISGVSLALTWPCRLCLLRVLLCASLCYKLLPFQAHWGSWHRTRFLRPACLFTAHVGSGSSPSSVEFSSHCHFYKFFHSWLLDDAVAPASLRGCLQLTWEVCLPPSPVEFSSLHHSHKLSHSWLLGAHPRSCWSLSGPHGLFIYSSRKDSLLPIFSSVRPTLFPTCLYFSYCLLLSFSFFPEWGSVCPGGYAALAQGCLWEYRSTTKLTLSMSSQALWAWAIGSPGAWGPSWFLHLMWNGDALHQLEVWRGQSFDSSQWFCLQGVSPATLQDFIIGDMLSASSL
jgi:hypothetical protein